MSNLLSSGDFQALMTTWKGAIDQSYDMFSVPIKLIFSERTKEVTGSSTGLPTVNSVNNRRKNTPDDYVEQTDTIKKEGNSTTVNVKIYWNPKEWAYLFNVTAISKDYIMVLAKSSDRDDISESEKMQYTDKIGGVHSFVRTSPCVPYGFESEHYCASLWRHQ